MAEKKVPKTVPRYTPRNQLVRPRGRSSQSLFLEMHKAVRQLGMEQYLLTIDNAAVRKAVARLVAKL